MLGAQTAVTDCEVNSQWAKNPKQPKTHPLYSSEKAKAFAVVKSTIWYIITRKNAPMSSGASKGLKAKENNCGA